MNADDRCRELANGGLMAAHRIEVGGDIRVDGERYVEPNESLEAAEGSSRFRLREVGEEPLVQ